MIKTKIQLSQQEYKLISDSGIILTKNEIIQKTKLFLDEIYKHQKLVIEKNKNSLPSEVMAISPKISKGENYKGLPWLVLDFPRYFNKGNTCAIRTLFWWGNFFSVTFHVSGKYKKLYRDKLIRSYSILNKSEFCICISENEWDHHFEKSNYQPIKEMNATAFKTAIEKSSFTKIGKKIPLLPFNKMENLLIRNYELLIRICN